MEENSELTYIPIADGAGLEDERAEPEPGPDPATCAD